MRRDDGDSGGDAFPAESLPGLVARLGEDLSQLVDSKLALLKIELRDDLRSYLRGAAGIAAGAVVLAVGLGLVGVAVAFLASTLLAWSLDLSRPMAQGIGFVAAGLLFMGGGTLVAGLAARRLRHTDPVPEQTMRELATDRDWLLNR
jgi:uncharacterized membrane protein YqjE